MSLFSFSRKNKQEAASDDSDFYSRAEDEATTARTRGKRKSKQANDSVDPVLPEKKRARRRLIGAVALVLAAVIGLPMVLDAEPQPLAENISIQIPSKDKPEQARKARQSVPAAATLDQEEQIVEPADAPAAPVRTASVNNAGSKNDSRAAVASKTELEEPKVASSSTASLAAKVETAPIGKQPNTTEPKAIAKLEPSSGQDSRDDARARAILEGRVATMIDASKLTADKKAEKYIVQVAALASSEKVNELRQKLKTAGIASHTQKVATASGEATRIRVGPFATKEEAEKMQARLAKLGLNGSLVPTL